MQTIRTARHALTLLPDMRLLLDTVFADVARAQKRVLIECYIFNDDKLGRGFADRLADAAARGVQVQLIYDPLGSQKTPVEFFEAMRAHGIDVRAYRPLSFMSSPGRLAPRDHSRVIVADDAAYTGGAAWGDQWLPKDQGGLGWHDVCCRIKGPCVEDFVTLFGKRWREASGETDTPEDYDTGERHAELALVADTPKRDSLVYLRHSEAFARARRRIWIASAYFYPAPPMLRLLYDAAARGVDVRVAITGPTDLPLLKRAAIAEYQTWLDRGLSLYEYTRTVMHSKYAVVDDDWCSVGTFNSNPTSIGLANEVNLFVFDPRFVERVAQQFTEDLSHARRVTQAQAQSRPFLARAVDELFRDTMDIADLLWGPPLPK